MHTLNFKNNDHITEGVEFVPLISDINDTEGVLIEHQELQGDSVKLEFALIEHKKNYYFIDCKSSVKEDVYITDGKAFICPNCRQELALISGFERKNAKVESYLRHKISDNGCIYKYFYNNIYEDAERKNVCNEGYTHKQLKLSTLRNIVDHGIKLNVPSDFSIEIKDGKPIVDFKYKEIFLTDALKEKKVLNGDSLTKGYRPDIVSFTDNSETVYIEVTVNSGKRVDEYYDIWQRLNTTVIEVRKKDNVEDRKNESDIYSHCDDKVIRKKVFRILYSPVVEKARQEKNEIAMRIADEKRKKEQKEILKKYVNETIKKVNKIALENKIFRMPVTEVNFENGGYTYKGFNNFEYPSYWYKISYKDVFVFRKLPFKIYKTLEGNCKDLIITKSDF